MDNGMVSIFTRTKIFILLGDYSRRIKFEGEIRYIFFPLVDQLESQDKEGLRKKQERNNYCSRGGKFIREKVTPFFASSRVVAPSTTLRVIRKL